MRGVCRWAVILVASLMVMACGGGGGGDPPPEPVKVARDVLPELSQDIPATGVFTDYRSRNYFPMSPGDTWTYTQAPDNPLAAAAVSRGVSAGSGTDIHVQESVAAGGGGGATYRRTEAGILRTSANFAGIGLEVRDKIGSFIEYQESFPPMGGTRRVIRQGELNRDATGFRDSYRFEYRQEFVGLESLVLAGVATSNIAHFRNVAETTVQPGRLTQPITTIVHREDTWWAPGIGLVKAERQAVINASGTTIEQPLSFIITQGTVSGEYVLQPAPDGSVKKIPLLHSALVHDPVRGRYYASVPSNGNRIAIIDAVTGVISYSSPVGSEPSELAMTADGSALFVALEGTDDVAKLRLPDMVEQWRARMPTTSTAPLRVVRIVASPTEPDTIAVSLLNEDFNATAAGVVLVRGGVVMPRRGGSENVAKLIVFGGNGQTLFGHGFDTTSYGLRRFSVLADGLRLDDTTPTPGDAFPQTLAWTSAGLIVDHSVYRASDFSLVARVGVEGQSCWPLPDGSRLVCPMLSVYSDMVSPIVVASSSTGVILGQTFYERGRKTPSRLVEIVPGARGSVALRMNGGRFPADSIWLFSSPVLE